MSPSAMTASFRILTRSLTYSAVLPDPAALLAAAHTLSARMPDVPEGYRLIGLGLSHLEQENRQPDLWDNGTEAV